MKDDTIEISFHLAAKPSQKQEQEWLRRLYDDHRFQELAHALRQRAFQLLGPVSRPAVCRVRRRPQ